MLNLECFVLFVNEAKVRKKFYGSLSGNQKWFPYSCLKTTKTSYLHSRNEHEWLWLLKSVLLFRNLLSLLMSINKEKEAKTNHNILYVHAILSNIFIVMQIKLLFSNWYPSINLKPYCCLDPKIMVFTIYILIRLLITEYYKIPNARMYNYHNRWIPN